MPSANNTKYVVVKLTLPTIGGASTSDMAVYGNRYGRPFDSKVNAQRSLTKRKGKRGRAGVTWEIKEVLS